MRICWAQWAMIAAVVILGSSQMLTACGNKGPLELPEELQEPSPATEANKDKKKAGNGAE